MQHKLDIVSLMQVSIEKSSAHVVFPSTAFQPVSATLPARFRWTQAEPCRHCQLGRQHLPEQQSPGAGGAERPAGRAEKPNKRPAALCGAPQSPTNVRQQVSIRTWSRFQSHSIDILHTQQSKLFETLSAAESLLTHAGVCLVSRKEITELRRDLDEERVKRVALQVAPLPPRHTLSCLCSLGRHFQQILMLYNPNTTHISLN